MFIAVRLVSFRWVLVIGFVSSGLFGYAHAIHTLALEPILRTLGAGMIFTAVFLKCGGFNHKVIKPSLCVFGIHALNNILALGAALFLISVGEM